MNEKLERNNLSIEDLQMFKSSVIDEYRNHLQQVHESFNQQLENYIKENLKLMGFEFQTQEEFYAFAKARITKVMATEFVGVHYFYLDQDTDSKLIGYYHKNEVMISKNENGYFADYTINFHVMNHV